MTPAVGTPSGMEPFALDAGTCERLLTGAVDVADAPPRYRGVALTLHALRADPDGLEWVGDSVAVEQITAVVVAHRRPRTTRRARRTRSSKVVARVAAVAAAAGALCMTGGLASAGSLPEPAQHAASAVLGSVGISVPTGEEPARVPEPTTTGSVPPSSATGGVQPDAGRAVPGENGTAGAGAPPAVPSTPAAPGNGQGELHGNKSRGTPPATANGHGNGRAGNGSPPADPGKGNGR